MLVHLLLRLLRHRCTGVLRGIRTSKLHEWIAAGTAVAVVQRQGVGVVVAAASGLYGASEDVCESCTLAFEVFFAAAGEEGDQEEDQAGDCDSADDASGYGAFVWLLY